MSARFYLRVRQLLEGGGQAGVARRNPKRVLRLRRGVLSWSAQHKAGNNKTRETDKERGGGGIASVGPAGVWMLLSMWWWCSSMCCRLLADRQTELQAE